MLTWEWWYPGHEYRWSDLWEPATFQWQPGHTPFSDPIAIAVAWAFYFSTILILKAVMPSREPFKLKYITAAHNIILCLWSLAMFLGTVYEVVRIISTKGVGEAFCSTERKGNELMWYVMYSYYLSKFYELFDTVILLLKKKPLIFLHWYHHAIVIVMVWAWLTYENTFASMGMMANTLVHVFMYYYYYAASLGHDVWFKRFLTTGQIIQFTVGFILSVPYMYFHFTKGCRGWNTFLFTMAVNATFLILFIDFYRRSYTSGKKGGKKDVDTKKKN